MGERHPQADDAPLAALLALDGDDLIQFEAHARDCAECGRERDAFVAVAGALGLAAGEAPPPASLKARVLGAAGLATPTPAAAPARWPLTLAASLAAALGAGFIVAQRQCEVNGDRAARLERAQGATWSRAQALEARQADLERRLRDQAAWQRLLAAPGTRLTALAASSPAHAGAAGRVAWNAEVRQAVLLAGGLQRAPAGRAYQVWVLDRGRPLPSALFQVSDEGAAAAALPWMEPMAGSPAFAVTLEPAAGSATPTGAMVLAPAG